MVLPHSESSGLSFDQVYYVLMLPLGCVFVWPLKMDVYGMWWSMVVGTGLATIALAIMLYRVDWAPWHHPFGSLAVQDAQSADAEERRLKENQGAQPSA